MMMKTRLTQGGVVLALLIGLSGAAAARDQYQFRVDKNGVQFGAALDPRQHGYEHAYRDGADRGRFDREHGVRYNLNAKWYHDTARGYEPFMGNKAQYQQGYGEGYKAGYDSAFHNEAMPYGQVYGRTDENRDQWQHATDPYAARRWSGSDLAFDVGYRDGVTSGQYDRGRGIRSDFQNTDGYRNADHGHGASYGEKAAYQAQYRTGFERGYQDGYRRSR